MRASRFGRWSHCSGVRAFGQSIMFWIAILFLGGHDWPWTDQTAESVFHFNGFAKIRAMILVDVEKFIGRWSPKWWSFAGRVLHWGTRAWHVNWSWVTVESVSLGIRHAKQGLLQRSVLSRWSWPNLWLRQRSCERCGRWRVMEFSIFMFGSTVVVEVAENKWWISSSLMVKASIAFQKRDMEWQVVVKNKFWFFCQKSTVHKFVSDHHNKIFCRLRLKRFLFSRSVLTRLRKGFQRFPRILSERSDMFEQRDWFFNSNIA